GLLIRWSQVRSLHGLPIKQRVSLNADLLSFLNVTKTCQINHVSVTAALDSRCCSGQMLGCKLRVTVHHHPRFPAAQILELIAARTGLTVPRSPRMPQVVKPEIRNSGFVDRRVPCAIGHLPRNRLIAIRKAEYRMLAPLS